MCVQRFNTFDAKLEDFAIKNYYYFVDRLTHEPTHGQTGCFEYTHENIRFEGVIVNRRDAAQHKRKRPKRVCEASTKFTGFVS